eukprot:TRINITY_DN2315_c1_g1_i3.p1 TRINITY_DN2315_c1_g1~~TRINITY_DN2315_c1_g1_i3.p1  ORF type:complete len:660 (+),score=76.35 TRINITY_DN2315_c1_g1_i3:300-1982(+)
MLSMGVGEYTFQVRGIDGAGNIETAPLQQSWSVALKPNIIYARIVESPWDMQPTKNATFQVQLLQGTETGDGIEVQGAIECRLNDQSWEGCANPITYIDLDDGLYTFEVRSVENYEGDALSVGSINFTVDTVAPVIAWQEDVPDVVSTSFTVFKFKSNEEVVTYACNLIPLSQNNTFKTSNQFTICEGTDSGSAQYSDLVDGQEYKFMVQATDQVGNKAPPLVHEFKVDASPPVVKDVVYPEATNAAAIIVAFSTEDPNNGTGIGDVYCRLFRLLESQNQTEWFECASPLSLQVPDEGVYGFGIRVFDLVNQSTSQDYQITVERSPPKVQITSTFDSINPVPRQFTVNWTGEDIGEVQSGVSHVEVKIDFEQQSGNRRRLQQSQVSNVQLKLDNNYISLNQWVVSSARPLVFDEVPSGQYVIYIRGVDTAGNIGNASQGVVVNVDSTIQIQFENDDDSKSNNSPNLLIIVVVIVGAIVLTIVGVLFIVFGIQRRSQSRRQYQQQQIVDVDSVRLQNAIELSTIDQMSQQAREEADLRAAIQASMEEANLQRALQESLEQS